VIAINRPERNGIRPSPAGCRQASRPDFEIDNSPLGSFSPVAKAPRPGVAIGDFIADLTSN
jgi:hypothetical protein